MATSSQESCSGEDCTEATENPQGYLVAPDVFREKLERHRVFVEERMDPNYGLVDRLRGNGAIVYFQWEMINAESVPFQKNRKILDFILEGSASEKIVKLREALIETKQIHLINYVDYDGVYNSQITSEWPLMERETKIIDANVNYLTEHIETADGLLMNLVANNTITQRQKECVSALLDSYKRNTALLDIIRRGSLFQYMNTIKVLQETNQGHIAKVLIDGGAILGVHIATTGKMPVIKHAEAEIVNQLMSVLQGKAPEEKERLLELTKLNAYGVIDAAVTKSIVLFFHCKTLSDFLRLKTLLDNKELQKIVEIIYNKFLPKTTFIEVTLTWNNDEFNKVKRFLEVEANHEVELKAQSPPKDEPEAQAGCSTDIEIQESSRKKVKINENTLENVAIPEIKAMLIERLSTDFGILDKLLACKALSRQDIDSVKKKTTSAEKNSHLLDLVTGKQKLREFFMVLKESHQEHLVNYVTAKGEYKPEYEGTWPLTNKMTEILDVNQESLVDLLDLSTNELVHKLFEFGFLNKRQREFLCKQPTDLDKATELLNMLHRSSISDYNIMIYCLNISKQSHVASILQMDEVGVLVPLQKVLSDDPDVVTSKENEMVARIANILVNLNIEDPRTIMRLLQRRLFKARRGQNIILCIWCKTLDELQSIHSRLKSRYLRTQIVQYLSHLFVRSEKFDVMGNMSEEICDRCEKSLEAENSQERAIGVGILKICQQLKVEKMQEIEEDAKKEPMDAEKKPVESVGGDDDDDDDGFYNDDDEDSDDNDGAGFSGVHLTGFFMRETKLQAEELLTRMDIIAAILISNTDYLTEYMRPEGLVDKLHAAQCLTDEDTRYIKTLKHRTEKNDEILSAINDGNKYDDLISCLRQTKQYVAADVVEKGGVALKIKVTFKKASLPGVEKRLVEIIGTLHDKSVPKTDHVMQFLSQLRRGSIEILNAQYYKGIVIWLWCRSEGALRNVCAIYRSKQLNKLLLQFFDLLINRQMPQPAAVSTNIEETVMEFAAWSIKLVQKQLLPVVEGVVCSTAVLPHTLFVLCQNPTEVLVFENKDYSEPSKRIALKDLTDPVDIVASHQAAFLYVTDAASSSVWKVTTNDGKVARWLQNVGDPYTLSLTTGGEVIMVRRGSPSTLEIYGPDGKILHDIKLPPNISLPNHAVETLTGSFFVSNGKESAKFTGVFEIDKGGNTIGYLDFGYEPIVHLSEDVNSILRNFCTETQLGYPRYLTLGKQNQLMSADFQNGGVMVFDRQLCLEQIVGKDDVKQTLRLCWKEKDNQLVIIHGEKRVIGIYEFSSDVTQ